MADDMASVEVTALRMSTPAGGEVTMQLVSMGHGGRGGPRGWIVQVTGVPEGHQLRIHESTPDAYVVAQAAAHKLLKIVDAWAKADVAAETARRAVWDRIGELGNELDREANERLRAARPALAAGVEL